MDSGIPTNLKKDKQKDILPPSHILVRWQNSQDKRFSEQPERKDLTCKTTVTMGTADFLSTVEDPKQKRNIFKEQREKKS